MLTNATKWQEKKVSYHKARRKKKKPRTKILCASDVSLLFFPATLKKSKVDIYHTQINAYFLMVFV